MQFDDSDLGDGLKVVFRDHPAAVTLITAITPAGPVGLTASSLASVAVDPPAVSFSVTRATGTAGALLGASTIQVHFLTNRHAEVARQFAVTGGDRFTDGQGWSSDADGAPRLAGARARFVARIVETVPVGGSVLVVAEVTAIETAETAPPLLYADRVFFTADPGHAPL